MRPRTVGILATVFALLLVSVLLVRSPRVIAAADTFAVVGVPPSQIRSLTLSDADGNVTLERRGIEWVMVDSDSTWPAEQRRVTAGLRLLASAIATPSETVLDPSDNDLGVVISTSSGESVIRIASRGLAGTRAALIDGRPAKIDVALAEMLSVEAVRAWADPRVFPGLDPAITNVAVQRWDGAGFELARVGQRWGVRSPIVTPADRGRVDAFIGRLGAARARMGPTDMIAPVFTVTASKGDGSWTLRVDPKGRGGVNVETPSGTLATRLMLEDDASQAIRMGLTDFLSMRSIDLPASDIAGFVLEPPAGAIRLERNGRTWTGDADLAEDLLTLLLSAEANEILPANTPDRRDVVTLRVERFGGLPAGNFTVWTTMGQLHVNDGGVTRSYPRSASATVAEWLSDLGS